MKNFGPSISSCTHWTGSEGLAHLNLSQEVWLNDSWWPLQRRKPMITAPILSTRSSSRELLSLITLREPWLFTNKSYRHRGWSSILRDSEMDSNRMSHMQKRTISKAWDAAYSLNPGGYKKGLVLVGNLTIFYYESSISTGHCFHHYYPVPLMNFKPLQSVTLKFAGMQCRSGGLQARLTAFK